MIKFKDWILSNKKELYSENSLGGLGGWFNGFYLHEKDKIGIYKNHTWEDYVVNLTENEKAYAECLKKEILKLNIRVTGEDHQHIMIPLFSDNTFSFFSYRAWGDLMAAIFTTDENPLTYMEYYM
jgi:hypothetical protein